MSPARCTLGLTTAMVLAALSIGASAASAEIAINTVVYTGPVDATITALTFDGFIDVACDGDVDVSVDGENDAGTMDSASVVNCTPSCVVTVNGTPYDFTVDATDGTVVVTDAVNLTANCGLLSCTFTGVANGVSGNWDIGLETIELEGELDGDGTLCGTGTLGLRIKIRRTFNQGAPFFGVTFGVTPNTTGLLQLGTILRWIEF